MGRVNGLVAVVTGGGRGIGRAIALALGAEGARVVVSSRTVGDLDKVVAAIRDGGSEAQAVMADAMDRDQARQPVRVAVESFGRVDVLVNNVGGLVGRNHDPFTCEDSVFEGTLVLSLVSAFWTSREALPHMRSQEHGRIINIGSGASNRAHTRVAYTAAKHGLVGFTRSLAAGTAAYGITVNCLCPGWINTSLVDWDAMARAEGVSPSDIRARAESESLQHRILEPDELAPMAVLLASSDGAAITGQVINVDGGYKV